MKSSATGWLRGVLFGTALLDELTFGFLVVGLPLARDSFHMTYQQVGLLFTVGAVAALVIEPAINLASDHVSKRVPILGGMFCLVVAFTLAGLTRDYALLLLAVALADPAIGAAVGLAQAALVEQRPALGDAHTGPLDAAFERRRSVGAAGGRRHGSGGRWVDSAQPHRRIPLAARGRHHAAAAVSPTYPHAHDRRT